MNEFQKACVKAYRKHQRLEAVGKELNVPWQTVYWNLKKVKEPVTGNKLRHGSEKDKFAAKSERYFKSLVPSAVDFNGAKFQAPWDFNVFGAKVEIKASSIGKHGWSFSLKKQSTVADFFVCFGYDESKASVERCFIFPFELVCGMQTLRVGRSKYGNPTGKWSSFEVKLEEIPSFFENLKGLAA